MLHQCLQFIQRFDTIYYVNGKKVASREECHRSQACKSLKRTCVGSNGILECRLLFSPFSGARQSSWSVAWDLMASSSAGFCLKTRTAVVQMRSKRLLGGGADREGRAPYRSRSDATEALARAPTNFSVWTDFLQCQPVRGS
jgi:hypothetical protein